MVEVLDCVVLKLEEISFPPSLWGQNLINRSVFVVNDVKFKGKGLTFKTISWHSLYFLLKSTASSVGFCILI